MVKAMVHSLAEGFRTLRTNISITLLKEQASKRYCSDFNGNFNKRIKKEKLIVLLIWQLHMLVWVNKKVLVNGYQTLETQVDSKSFRNY